MRRWQCARWGTHRGGISQNGLHALARSGHFSQSAAAAAPQAAAAANKQQQQHASLRSSRFHCIMAAHSASPINSAGQAKNAVGARDEVPGKATPFKVPAKKKEKSFINTIP